MKIVFDIDPEDLDVDVIPWSEDKEMPPAVRPKKEKKRDPKNNKQEGDVS